MSHCPASAGSLSALLIELPKCADAGSTQQHPGFCFPSLPCQVMDHIPAATKARGWSLSPVAQTQQGLRKWGATAWDVPPFPPPIHSPVPPTATPKSQKGEDKSPRCISAKQMSSPRHFKETNQA